MDEEAAGDLVRLARSSPAEAMATISSVLAHGHVDSAVRSIATRALGEAARWSASVDDARRFGAEAVDLAIDAERDDLRREALLTLSGSHHIAGYVDDALAALDDAAAGLTFDDELRSRIEFQQATILAREGEARKALTTFDRIIPLFEQSKNTRFVGLSRQNRGMISLEQGAVAQAVDDFTTALEAFESLNLVVPAAAMHHNLARAHGMAGRLPIAWHHLELADAAFADQLALKAEVNVSRVEILLHCGLFDGGRMLADATVTALGESGHANELAEAHYHAALANLACRRHGEAADHARAAEALLREQGRESWACRAEVALLRSQADAGDYIDARYVASLAARLSEAGQSIEAARAWATVADLDPDQAASGLEETVGESVQPPLELRLLQSEVAIRAAIRVGDIAGALESSSRSLERCASERAPIAAADLAAAMGSLTFRIDQLGLRLRLEHGRPSNVVRWVNRSRDVVTSPTGSTQRTPQTEQALGELRSVNSSGEDSPAVERRRIQLQRKLARLNRSSQLERHRSARALPRSLSRHFDGRTGIQFFELDGQLWRASINGRVAIERLISVTEFDDAIEKLRARVDACVRRSGRFSTIERHIRTIDRLLFVEPLKGPVVLSPLPRHLDVPWGLFPSLANAALVVAPTFGRSKSADLSAATVLLGPGLRSSATREARSVATSIDAHLLEGESATVAAALASLANDTVVHFVCHGDRQPDGRFSRLFLSDGSLTAFDIEALPRTAGLVTFSACDAGWLQPAGPNDAVGFSSTLMRRGTHTIVAASSALPDADSTANTFERLYSEIAGGSPVGDAVAAVRRGELDEENPRLVPLLLTCLQRA